jgi:hypothetical protein
MLSGDEQIMLLAMYIGPLVQLSLLLGFWTLSIVQISTNKKTQRFGNWIYFRPQARVGWGAPTLQETKILPYHLRTETDPVSETLCFLVCGNPDDGQSPET